MKIFATTGSRSFQFNRLVEAVDKADFASIIDEPIDIFAQIGCSSYKPRNIKWVDFLSRDEFQSQLDKADIVVTHAGTGAVVGALNKGKKVVAIPRRVELHEAVDNHQVELVRQFANMGIIEPCMDPRDIVEACAKAYISTYSSYRSNTGDFLDDVEAYIETCGDCK